MKHNSYLLSTGTALILAATGLMANAAQWKWLDQSGHPQYSDRPPPADIPDKNILQRPNFTPRLMPVNHADAASAPANASAAAPKASDPELEARRRKEQQAQEAAQKAAEEQQAKAKADNCARAKSYQRTLNDGMRIARTNEKGEREILDDDARAKEQARVSEVIKSDCQ